MGICSGEFVTLVIRPTLKKLGIYTDSFEQLLIGTAAAETGIGLHLAQPGHEGLGVYLITPTQHRQVWDNYLAFHPELASLIRGCASQQLFLEHPDQELAFNLQYATAIAAAIYLQAMGEPPQLLNSTQLANLWQRYYRDRPRGDNEACFKYYSTSTTLI